MANWTQRWISYSKFCILKVHNHRYFWAGNKTDLISAFVFQGFTYLSGKTASISSTTWRALDIYPQERFARLKTYWDIVFLLLYQVMYFMKQINQIRHSKPLYLSQGEKTFQVAPKTNLFHVK